MNTNWVLTANDCAAAWAPAIWKATWQGSIFIAAIWLIVKAFKNLSPSARYWLWWIASLQMALRLLLVSGVALPILPSHSPTPVIETATTEITPTAFNYVPAPKIAVENSLPQKAPEAPKPSFLTLALLAWIVGVGTCLTISCRRLLGTRKLLKNAEPIEAGPIFDIVQEFSIDRQIRLPRLLQSKAALCPLLAGWLKPAIVLPLDCESKLDDTQLRMALAHEFAHLNRRDLWLGIVPAITQSLFFFHPMAWLATHEGAASREAACDAEAMRTSGGTPAAYARLLLTTAQSRSSMAVLGTAFGYRLIQRRISMLKSMTGSTSQRYRFAATTLIALGAICALPWSVTAQPAPTAHKVHKKLVKKTKKATTTTVRVWKSAKSAAKIPPAHNLVALSAPPSPTRAAMAAAGISPVSLPAVRSPLPPRASAPAPMAAMSPTGTDITIPARPAMAPSAFSGAGLPSQAAVPPERTFPPTPARQMTEDGANVVEDHGEIVVELNRADLHQALRKYFKLMHINFVIKSDVEQDSVTADLTGRPIETVIQRILSSVKQHLTYRVEEGVYVIMPANKD